MLKPRILTIDDDIGVQHLYSRVLSRSGLEVITATLGQDGIDLYRKEHVDAVLVDLKMPDMGGIEVIHALKNIDDDVAAVIVTGYGTIPSAVEAMKAGALDYMTKPIDVPELQAILTRAMESRRKFVRLHQLEQQIERQESFEGLVGISPKMQGVYSIIERAARTDTTVLIQGETGTGKELVARALHNLSGRTGFLPINCGALPDDILESELFGHEKGAFTGAIRQKLGLLEQANGGTLFLDEIEAMSPSLQVKLLRAIQEREILRIGGDHPISVDFRLITSSNETLHDKMKQGHFRSDLYYRLSVMVIDLPPLRQRTKDIPLLARHFVHRIAEKLAMAPPDISPEAMMLLSTYTWPGNVRELENALEQGIVLSGGGILAIQHLPEAIISGIDHVEPEGLYERPLKEARDQFEKSYLQKVLKRADGVVAEAARLAGINRQYFYEKMKRYDLSPD